MKKYILYLIPFLMFISCKNEDKLTFEPVVINKNECETCPLIEISIPKAIDGLKIDKTINTAIREEIISSLNYDDETEVSDIETAITSFNKAYIELKEKFADETIQWEARINGNISFEDKTILSIQLESFLFTGGAHGYSSKRFLNFDKVRGLELENWQLFKDEASFLKLAETKFRQQEKIPEAQPINSTGFMFDSNTFYLPENIGYTKEGLQLLYEQYEIASYADGPISITIPFTEIKSYLEFPVRP